MNVCVHLVHSLVLDVLWMVTACQIESPQTLDTDVADTGEFFY